jgi:hypothetical protein
MRDKTFLARIDRLIEGNPCQVTVPIPLSFDMRRVPGQMALAAAHLAERGYELQDTVIDMNTPNPKNYGFMVFGLVHPPAP